MKNNKGNRIDELKIKQKQKLFIQTFKSKNYPPHQIFSAITDEEIWERINQGKVIERVEEISLEALRKWILHFFLLAKN